jgi:2-C-methyl-D-erythritol 4-phosphate cytidylyltransferase
MEVWSIVLAAGAGSRFGAAKQFAELHGVRLVDRAVGTASESCEAVVVVLPEGAEWKGVPVAAAVAGGATRAASVRCGLKVVEAEAQIIVVHDAAHPLASAKLFESTIEAVRLGADAAIPGLPINETIMRMERGWVVDTVAHNGLVAAQMPHAFRSQTLRAVHVSRPEATDDAALVQAWGGTIAVVPGHPRNIHVTTREELGTASILAKPA